MSYEMGPPFPCAGPQAVDLQARGQGPISSTTQTLCLQTTRSGVGVGLEVGKSVQSLLSHWIEMSPCRELEVRVGGTRDHTNSLFLTPRQDRMPLA